LSVDVSALVLTEVNAAGSIEFEGPAKDSVSLDMITDYGQKQETRNQGCAYLLTADPVQVPFAKAPTSGASSNLVDTIRHWHSHGDSSHSGR
jgi:hypothetical protein